MKLGRQKIKYVPTDSLKAMERPLKKHDDVERLIESFNQFGWTIPILVQRGTNRIVAGHGRWLAAKREGLKQVPVIFKDFDDQQANAYAIVDNQLTEISPWDPTNLEHHVTNLEKRGYDLGWTGLGTKVPGGKIVKEDTPPEKSSGPPKSKRGQIYALGAHRLMCGDATSVDDGARLMGGAQAHMVFTDPPWNVAIGKDSNPRHRQRPGLMGDDMPLEDYKVFLGKFAQRIVSLTKGDIYVVLGASNWPYLDLALRGAGFHWSATVIWVKDVFVLGRSKYHRRYEPLWYGWHGKGKSSYQGDRKQDDVWEIPRPRRSDDHPTMKPVELAARAIGNSSKEGETVYDGFAGSGSTVVAAEQMGRVARVMEIDPGYADVVRRRYFTFVNDGEEKGWEAATPPMTGLVG